MTGLKIVETEKHGAATQIYSLEDQYCLSARKTDRDYIYWTKNCSENNKETHFHYDENHNLRTLIYDTSKTYVTSRFSWWYYGNRYGTLYPTDNPHDDIGAKWKIEYDGETKFLNSLRDEL